MIVSMFFISSQAPAQCRTGETSLLVLGIKRLKQIIERYGPLVSSRLDSASILHIQLPLSIVCGAYGDYVLVEVPLSRVKRQIGIPLNFCTKAPYQRT